MFELSLENKLGNSIKLTGNESDYQVINIDGLNPPNASISDSTISGVDGSKFISSKLETRNVVITVKINGDVEANRNRLYTYAKTKHYCKIIFKNERYNVYAEGYINTIECPLFTNSQIMQISIICQEPYLKSVNEIIANISKELPLFHFPFSFGADGITVGTITDNAIEFSNYDVNRIVNIYNSGSETGLTMTFDIIGGSVANLIIYDVITREFFGLDVTFNHGDKIIINTNRGEKSVTLTRANVTTNIINYLKANSTWLQLQAGDNLYTYEVDSGVQYIYANFVYTNKYEGV